MKRILLFLATLISVSTFASPGIHEALKNPSAISILNLCGEKDEAALLTKNAKRFTSLNRVFISNISDSISVEQDISAIAACSNVHRLDFENCGIRNLSGAVKMLVSVNEVGISNCQKLSADQAFSVLSEMTALKKLNYETDHLTELPDAFFRLRGLQKISIRNTDLSLADGYALNNSSPESLYASDSLSLGFGADQLVLEYGCYDKTSLQSHINIMRDLLQGAAGVSGKMTLPQRAIAFNRNNPLVHPPFPGVDVRKNIYETDAAAGGEIEYPSGTRIFIPQNAFVDANGNEVKGNVTIDYREFRDPVDILVSGIPMDYDSGGVKNHFVSAGMFEMNASVNGQEVFLAPGKNVDMKFAVVDTGDDFNFYKLDEQKGWQYLNNPGKVEKDNADTATQPETFSEALISFYNWRDLQRISEKGFDFDEYDTTDSDTRYASTDYIYERKKKAFEEKNSGSVIKNSSYFSLQKTFHRKDTTCFKIARLSRLNFNNPELSAYAGVTWMTTDKINSREMRRLFHKRSGINDCRITQEGDGFVLEFKTLTGFKKINAVPSRMQNGHPVEYKEKFQNSLYRRYSRQLTRREWHLDRTALRNMKKMAAQSPKTKIISTDSILYWKKVKPQMTPAERKMDFNAWMAYYEEQLPKLIQWENSFKSGMVMEGVKGAGNAQAEALYQALSISSFGIFNCDGYPPLQNPVATNAKIDVQGMKDVHTTNIYLINKDVNTSVNFMSWRQEPINIKYDSQGKNVLIGIDAQGRIYFTDENAFGQATREGDNTRFPAVLVTDKPATPQQLRDLISGEKK